MHGGRVMQPNRRGLLRRHWYVGSIQDTRTCIYAVACIGLSTVLQACITHIIT